MALTSAPICTPTFVIPTESDMMMRFMVILLFVVGSVAVLGSTAEADLVIQVSDTTIDAGGTGFVDVAITGSNDPISIFDIQFEIVPIGTVSSAMRFIDPQPDPQLSDPVHAINYVFANISDNVTNGFPMGFVTNGTTFNGSDGTVDFRNVLLSTERLLVRLGIESVVPGGGDAWGDQFEISLTAANFFDSNANAIPYSPNSGLVTVIPEPSTFAVLSFALGVVLCLNRFTRSGEGIVAKSNF